MKIAVFPGSFDPITLGHLDIIQKADKIFDLIIIALGRNDLKNSFLKSDVKMNMLKKVFQQKKNIIIKQYNSLTIDFCKKNNAKFIIRGVRNTLDFEAEKQLALMNEDLENSITTIFIPCSKQYEAISSSIVKDIIKNKGQLEKFIPKEIITEIKSIHY